MIGNIFVNVWGSSMTIVDFYQVTEETIGTFTLRQIKAKEVSDGGFLTGYSVPLKDQFTDAKPIKIMKRGQFVDSNGALSFKTTLGRSWATVIRVYNPGRNYHFNHCD